MQYEINVALKGQHFFATAERSLTNANKAAEVYAYFKKAFPASKGFSVTASMCETTGHDYTATLEHMLKNG